MTIQKEHVIEDIETALSLLTDPDICKDLGTCRSDKFRLDLNALKEAFLSGSTESFDEQKIAYFRGPTPYDNVYTVKTCQLFYQALKILNGLSLFRIAAK